MKETLIITDKIRKKLYLQNLSNYDKVIIPDEEFSKYIPVSWVLTNMEPYTITVWPASRARVVCSIASRLNKIVDGLYRTSRDGDKYIVCRFPKGILPQGCRMNMKGLINKKEEQC